MWILGCNIQEGDIFSISSTSLFLNKLKISESKEIIIPGLVQNWPDPIVIDLAYFAANSEYSFLSFLGKIKTGLTLPISAKTGIGVSLFDAKLYIALPPLKLPVNPTAFM